MARRLFEEWFVEFRFPGHETAQFVETDLGPVPSGWSVSELSDITALIARGIAPMYDDSADTLVLNQKCIRDQRLSLDQARRQSRTVSAEKQIRSGDVLVNSTGVGTLGRVAQVQFAPPGCAIDTHVSIVRPRNDIDADFFGAALKRLEPHFAAQGVGSTGQTELGRVRIGQTRIVVPPKEMRDEFGRKTRPTELLVHLLSCQNSNLRRTRDLLLPQLVSGEIDLSDTAAPEETAAA
jgi:type I restriction enzyme, S subunit